MSGVCPGIAEWQLHSVRASCDRLSASLCTKDFEAVVDSKDCEDDSKPFQGEYEGTEGS